MTQTLVSVVVPARDAAGTLGRTLTALEREAGGADCEVIVVDNGSLDRTAALAERAPAVTRVIRRERGEGPGEARNAGVAAAEGETIAFLDADCVPAPGWLAAGSAAIAGADVVQGRVLPDPGIARGPFDRTLSVTCANGLFETANLFVRRELFDRLGGFPPGLEPDSEGEAPFGEDVLFGWRAVRAGARVGFCERALAYHAVFERGPGAYVSERTRLRLFPSLAAMIPELRDSFLYRRYFLDRRSARFDLALAGAALALASSQPLALAASLPYARLLASSAWAWGPSRAPAVALTQLAADAVGALALLRGSLTTRAPVL